MKVKAKRIGFYGNKRRKAGSVFNIKDVKEFSKAWMEEIKDDSKSKKSSKAKPAEKDAVKDSSEDVI